MHILRAKGDVLSTWTEHEFLFVIRLSHRTCRWDGVKDVRALQHLETRCSLSNDRDLGIPGFSNPEDARNDQDDPLRASHKVTQSALGKCEQKVKKEMAP